MFFFLETIFTRIFLERTVISCYRRKFRSQTSDNMDRLKAVQGRGREKRKIRRERVRRKKMQMREKAGKSRNTVFFQWFGALEGRKSRLAKAAGAEPAGQRRDEHLHAVVARSTFPSQNVQNTTCSDHFWKFRCRKSACRCGAKHISKSKRTKHHMFGPLLEVQMSKKCMPLWREAHFEVKTYKTPHVRTTFGSSDVEKVHAVVARSTFPSQNVQNTTCSDHFWKFRCRKSARRCGAKHISKSKCTKNLGFGPLVEVQMSLRFASLHYITLHYTPLHYTTLHSATLQLQLHNYIHYIPLHSTTLHYTKLHYATLHYITLHYTTFHYTSLHSTTLHSTTTTLHYTPLHSTTLHYTPLH